MPSRALDRMHARVRAVKARAAVHAWQYRQRRLAAGAWFRLRRVLTRARTAFVISDADARRLVADGYRAEPCGRELSPEKTLIFVDESRLSSIANRREIPVRLGPEFFAASSVALVPFTDR